MRTGLLTMAFIATASCSSPSEDPKHAPLDPTTATATADSPAVSAAPTSAPAASSSPQTSAPESSSTTTTRVSLTVPKAPKPSSSDSCFKLWATGREALHSAQRALAGTCTSDADCVGISDSLCDFASCGGTVAKSEEGAYLDYKKKVEAAICTPFNAVAQCKSAPIPIPSCPPMRPSCVGGSCASKR